MYVWIDYDYFYIAFMGVLIISHCYKTKYCHFIFVTTSEIIQWALDNIKCYPKSKIKEINKRI